MIGRIPAGDSLVMRLGDDLVATHHDRADWHFIFGCREPRLLERRIHPGVTTHNAPRTPHRRDAPRTTHHAPPLPTTHRRYARTGSRAFSKLSAFPSFVRSIRIR